MGRKQARNLIFILCGIFSAYCGASELYTISDLSGGLNDSVPGNFINDNEVSDISNLHVDPFTLGLVQRYGSSRQNSTQLSGKVGVDPWTYVQQSGTEYIIAFASKTIAYSTDYGATFTSLITTATVGTYWDCTVFIDNNFYCVSQDTSAFDFNGTVHVVTTQTPAGKYIEAYQNRIWVGNTAANPGRLFFSDLLLPSSFTTTSNYIDFPEALTGIGAPYDGGLPVYTDNTAWMLRGDDPTNFYTQEISNIIGCANNRTIKNFTLKNKEYQIFLSKGHNQTENMLYALDGSEVQPIGYKIKNTLAGINIGNSSRRSKEWDTQTDFAAGTFSSTTGTYISGSVILSTSETNVTNNGFESGSGSGWITSGGAVISTYASCSGSTILLPRSDTYFSVIGVGLSNSLILDVLNYDGGSTVLASQSYSLTTNYVQYSIDLSAYRGQKIFIRLRDAYGNSITSDGFYASANPFTFYAKQATCGSSTYFGIDDTVGGKTSISSGTYTSEVYQTDANLSQWGNFDVEHSLNNGTIIYYIRTATGTAALSAAPYVAIIDGAQISTTTNQFVQWKADISSGTSVNLTQIELKKVTINWVSSSGPSQQPDAEIYKSEYWLAYPGQSQSRNQSVLVMNQDGKFTKFDYGTSNGSYGLCVSKGLLFSGDSATDTVNGGYLWEYETGNTDNGTAVTSYARLKDNEFALPDYQKSFIAAYFNYEVSQGTFTASILENFSEFSNDYTIQFGSGTLINRWKLEPNQQTTAKQLALNFTNSYSGSRLKLYPPITYYFEKVRLIPQ